MQETQETRVGSLGWENPLEEGMATHSSIFAWRIPWTEEPGGLQSIKLQRVGHDWSYLVHAPTHIIGMGYIYDRKTIAAFFVVVVAWHVGSNSPTKDLTWDPCTGSIESQPLDHQGSPNSRPLTVKYLKKAWTAAIPTLFSFLFS